MRNLSNRSITTKFSAIILLTSALSLSLATTAFVVYDVFSYRRATIDGLYTLARVVAENSTAPLLFKDSAAAQDTLSGFHAEPGVTYAAIFDKNGALFSHYRRDSETSELALPTVENWKNDSRFQNERHIFNAGVVDVFKNINIDGETVGHLVLQSDLQALGNRVKWDLIILIFFMLVACGIAFLLSIRLQRTILQPVLALAKTMRDISYNKNYAVRVQKHNDDEIGLLIDGFNEMVEQIHLRDEKLENAVDDLQKAKKVAESANAAKSKFLANVSHEVRSPMNGILGTTDLILNTNPSTEQKRFVKTIRRSTESLLRLVNDIIDFSKIESGRMHLEIIEFNLLELIEDIVELFGYQAYAKGLELTYAISSEIPSNLRGDPTRLRQVLVNLISNAIKFSEQGEIVLRVLPECSSRTNHLKVRFEVSDSGIGIHPAAKQRLFEAFRQADDSMTRRYGGSGLGLAISRELVEMMNGHISVESEPGVGSIFYFAALFEISDVESSVFPANAELKERRVLVFSERQTIQNVLCEQLSTWGLKAQPVSNLELVPSIDFDMAVFDVAPATADDFIRTFSSLGFSTTENYLFFITTMRDYDRIRTVTKHWPLFTKPIRYSHLYKSFIASVDPLVPVYVDSDFHTPILENKLVSFRAHVLLAEDNVLNQDLALAMLHHYGCKVDVVDNGQKAIDALTQKSYDLVLMDLQMPVMDGIEALKIIRTNEHTSRTKRIPIVAITAHASKSVIEQTLKNGADDYLAKPFEQNQLASILYKWLEAPVVESSNIGDASHNPHASEIGTTDSVLGEDTKDVLDENALNNIRAIQRPGSPNLLAKTIHTYIDQSVKLLATLSDAIKHRDNETLYRTAHSLRTSSLNLGAKSVANVCHELERAGHQQNSQNVKMLFETLMVNHHQACEALRYIARSCH